MDKDSKKGVNEMEEFAAKIADKQDNPTIHELAKAFPEKTYRELEKYRDADRHAEANQIPLTDAQKNLVEHIKAGACIMGEMRKDRQDTPTKMDLDYYKSLKDAAKASQLAWEKEHKLRQEAETETILVKGIGMNSPEMKSLKSEVEALKQQLHTDREGFQSSLDTVKKENNELFNRIAELTEIDESHRRLNGKLQVRIAELEDENQKIHRHLDKQVEESRKAGM